MLPSNHVSPATPSIQALDERIRKLEDELRALKIERNALLPISRLPVEIMRRIFLYVRDSHVQRKVTGDDAYERQNHWAEAIQICHSWRSIALNHPQLWQILYLPGRPIKLRKKMFDRSKPLPLYLKLESWTSRFSLAPFTQADRSRRLEELCLYVQLNSVTLHEFCYLKRLYLYFGEKGLLKYQPGSVESLSNIQLECATFTSAIIETDFFACFSNLRVASFVNCDLMDDVDAIFSALPHLQSLSVINSPFYIRSNTIVAEALEMLVFYGSGQELERIFRSVRMPRLRVLRVEICLGLRIMDGPVWDWFSQYMAQVSQNGAPIRYLSVDSLRVEGSDSNITIQRDILTNDDCVPPGSQVIFMFSYFNDTRPESRSIEFSAMSASEIEHAWFDHVQELRISDCAAFSPWLVRYSCSTLLPSVGRLELSESLVSSDITLLSTFITLEAEKKDNWGSFQLFLSGLNVYEDLDLQLVSEILNLKTAVQQLGGQLTTNRSIL